MKLFKVDGKAKRCSEEMGTGTSSTQSQSPFLPKALKTRSGCWIFVCLFLAVAPAQADEPRPLWTTSKVVGSPNPPLPFRVKQTFKNLTLPCPIGVAREPGQSSLLLWHQLSAWGGRGRVLRIADDPEVKETQLLLDLDVLAYGVAFHPDYVHNGYLFVGSNGPMDSNKKTTRVTRYTVARQPPYAVVPGSAQPIIEWLSDGHNGGDVAFGPDGMLYVTSGDGTSDSDMNLVGQDLTRLNSKVLRIDVDHPDAGRSPSCSRDIRRSSSGKELAPRPGLTDCAIPGGFTSIDQLAISGWVITGRICGMQVRLHRRWAGRSMAGA